MGRKICNWEGPKVYMSRPIKDDMVGPETSPGLDAVQSQRTETGDLKLGLHTYTLHLSGFGQNWGTHEDTRPKQFSLEELMDKAVDWGLDGLHLTGADLESKTDDRLEEVRQAAEDRGLYLEYNFSRDEEFDPRLNDEVHEGIRIADKLDADLAKLSLDIRRPRPLYGSDFHPKVMDQLVDVYEEVQEAIPVIEETGVKLALENHTETFADEIIWLLEEIDHPLVGACVDTVNSIGVLENPEYAVERMAPYAFCNHFCDHRLDRDQFGARFHGVALGDGDIDLDSVLETLRTQSPTDRITFEVEWAQGTDSFEEAREKEMKACIESIDYAQNELGIGQ